jgi:transketolase
MNSAYGLALDNLYYLVDWNDFGIDDHPVSVTVHGSPTDWFGSHGWRVFSAEFGSEWGPVAQAILAMIYGQSGSRASVAWFKTRKGRGYGKYDNSSHGAPHKTNTDGFWETKRPFMEKYGVQFANFGGSAPQDAAELRAEFEANLKVVIDVLHRDQELVDYIADRLVGLGNSVPEEITPKSPRQSAQDGGCMISDYPPICTSNPQTLRTAQPLASGAHGQHIRRAKL